MDDHAKSVLILWGPLQHGSEAKWNSRLAVHGCFNIGELTEDADMFKFVHGPV